MKISFKYTLGLVMGASLALTACQNDFDDPGLKIPEATLQSNISLADFKELSWNSNAMQLTEENGMGDYIIKGRVISSDATGNIYQSLVIQDETAALPITIRRASLFNEYHLGQEIVINTRGLWLGKYNGLIQLGWLSSPYNGEDQLTFMSFAEFQYHTQLNGLPNPTTAYIMPGEQKPTDGIYCQVLDIDNLPTSGEEMYNLQGQLVEFRNVSFEDGGKETFAPYQENANRYIQAEGGSLKLIVRNSGYATFYNNILPEGTGTVRGILSWYGDGTPSNPGEVGGWQLLLRSLDDLDFDSKGDEEDPYSVTEARQIVGQGYNGWVSGYVIGSVKSGVSNLTSTDDIIFGADADLPTNLVIATTAETRNLEDMMVVNLPQNSALRSSCNLVDNPSVLGRLLNVRGEFTEYLGFAGVAGSGEEGTFKLDASGVGPSQPVGGPVEDGDGSKASPFSVNQVIASTSNSVDVWVEGYVVGYVDTDAWSTGAVIDSKASTSANYTDGTNVILSNVPFASADLSNSVPAGLTSAVRPTLAISKNPSIFGKRVKVKGTVAKYMEVRGVKNIVEFEIL